MSNDLIYVMRGIKFTLIPTEEQEEYFKNAANTARWAYNFALAAKIEYYEKTGKNLKEGEIRKMITELKNTDKNYRWLWEVSNNVTKQAVKDCDRAFTNFFRGNARFPKFKKKRRCKDSFYVEKLKFLKIGNKAYVKIEKLDSLILLSKEASKASIHLLNGRCLNPRISFNGRRWELSVSINLPMQLKELKDEVIGIDLGVKNTIVCSDGTVYENINKINKNLKKLEKKKKKLQRKISRKYEMNKDGDKYIKTKNIEKEEKKLLRICNRISNIRKDYNHKISRKIVNKLPKAIVMEDLNIKGMLKNRHLAKAIQEQNFNRLIQYIKYKAESQGTLFILADRNFKSTQLCSNCGRVHKMSLGDRIYMCECGLVIDRDLNSALNLKKYGENYLNTQTA